MTKKETNMNKLIAATIMSMAPAVAFAGGHSAFSGHGTGVTVDTKTIEASSGMHFQQTTNDVWIYDNPPEGFPAAVKATCNWFMVFAAGQQQPSGGAVNCQAVNPDGSIGLFAGTFQPNGTVEPTLVAATGQWAPFIGATWIGQTTNDLGGSSVYKFEPKS